MVHRPTRVGTVGSCIAFEEDSPGVFLRFFFRKNTQAMQDPPELIDVQTIGTVGLGIAFEEDSPGIFRAVNSRKNTQAMQDPAELIF